ncbi:MAG: HNH endonuclease signature motif containing protein [Gemmatimonadaceae bacterium]
MPADRSAILAKVCAALDTGDREAAANRVRQDYPFEPVAAIERKYGDLEATRIFFRDGFIDRYAGTRLVFPGVLRVLSAELPEDFPFHPNWKMSETHEAFWELSPTIDHIIPVSRGGRDDAANWVTTSMRRNSAKSNWTLEELGWALCPAGALHDWDGLTSWFVRHVAAHPSLLQVGLIARWNRAALDAGAR